VGITSSPATMAVSSIPFTAILSRIMILPAAARGLGLAVALTAAPAMSQATIGISADYMGYTFGDGLGAEAAQLFMLPVAVRIPISDKVSFDIASTWAQGTIERDNTQFKLQGVTDTRVLATYQASPWAIVSFGANVPTGQVKHDAQEAIVASVLSTELLGFREATFGSGLALTSAVATAMRAGGWGHRLCRRLLGTWRVRAAGWGRRASVPARQRDPHQGRSGP
jgi:hypothetical protein